ncbi:MAG TPA: glycosyltransferase [Longimicrobiales bacterium]|nr:glycosyltransferase [Longimicrobiales bacterium]
MKSKIALYSPGMVGLGHMRRNLMLARQIAATHPDAAILMLAEAREACAFEFPARVDCVSLPGLRKDAGGVCSPRHLPVDTATLVTTRSRVLEAALTSFEPDVLIVDHLPAGALGELELVLPALAANGRTRFILGLRDILDSPSNVQREWERAGHELMIRRFYQQVWVYGDPAVFDMREAYGFSPAVRSLMRYTGYLNPRVANASAVESVELLAEQMLDDRRLVLCQVGGGQDGLALAESFLEATLPEDAHGILLTGPFMSPADRLRLRMRARMRRHFEVIDFVPEPLSLLARASRVITMGGYNSVVEALAYGKRALIVPRATPRCEQLMRAETLASLGVVDVLDQPVNGEALTRWLKEGDDVVSADAAVDLDGLARMNRYLDEVLRSAPGAGRRIAAAGRVVA